RDQQATLTTALFMFTGCLSGAFSLVTVHQPAVLSAALGQDVIMPCELRLQDEKLLSQPILYWWKLNEMAADFIRLIPSQTPNNSRATLLDNNGTSTNKSMILKSVQWADSGKYRCKLSLHTERNGNFRQKGDTTSLVVYGKYKAEDLLFFCLLLHMGLCLSFVHFILKGFAVKLCSGSSFIRNVFCFVSCHFLHRYHFSWLLRGIKPSLRLHSEFLLCELKHFL
uniref:Ig-like domain-containing protein n=1 Tax=Neolamprologus brichardi TaxID=32507 RepID=A0A3Q4N793_NEOBR